MVKIIIFILVSALLTLLSWRSLKSSRFHDFFRFFAFEGILILVLINMNYWFRNPFSAQQVISWLLLVASIFLAVHGFYLLRIIGKPDNNFENTTVLVQVGAYKFIRHPLYSSLLAGAWGAFLKHVSIASVVFVLLVSGFLIATAKVEEEENYQKFGKDYHDYQRQTKMFIPFIF